MFYDAITLFTAKNPKLTSLCCGDALGMLIISMEVLVLEPEIMVGVV